MHTVLIVDDDVTLQRTLARVLCRAGFEVVSVGGGLDALRRIKEPPLVSAVLLDFQMPAMMGPEVLRSIVAVRPQLPVLMLSAAMSTEEKTRALKGGARQCLDKPISATALVAALLQELAPG